MNRKAYPVRVIWITIICNSTWSFRPCIMHTWHTTHIHAINQSINQSINRISLYLPMQHSSVIPAADMNTYVNKHVLVSQYDHSHAAGYQGRRTNAKPETTKQCVYWHDHSEQMPFGQIISNTVVTVQLLVMQNCEKKTLLMQTRNHGCLRLSTKHRLWGKVVFSTEQIRNKTLKIVFLSQVKISAVSLLQS